MQSINSIKDEQIGMNEKFSSKNKVDMIKVTVQPQAWQIFTGSRILRNENMINMI